MKPIIKVGNVEIGNGSLVLIGGPCMAESLELCLETATYLKSLCAELGVGYIFKASYDKANRSGAHTRRGPGLEAGLEILSTVKSELNLPVVTDVHESSEVETVAKVVDMLQIPAFLCRQTDLLVAAGHSGLAINIKKGQFMAPEDMAGALDKVRSTGNENVMLCERGSSFGYHNLVVDFRSLPTMGKQEVPIVFDATHSVQLPGGLGGASGGNREFIRPLTRAACAIGIDALFAEVHPDPDNAWSDGPNSLSFADIRIILTEAKRFFDLNISLKES